MVGAITTWVMGALLAASLESEAIQHAYNLDHARGLALAEEHLARDERDATAHRVAAAILHLQMMYERGTISADSYLGEIQSPSVAGLDPPRAELVTRYAHHAHRAVELARARCAAAPTSADAAAELAQSEALLATYAGTVEGRVLDAAMGARRAQRSNEKALALDPNHHAAHLVKGSYRYFVGSLPLGMRLLAQVAGFSSGRTEGIADISTAARSGPGVLPARMMLVILLNRERRYADAISVIHQLRRDLPRNRHLLLEEGSTRLRAGQPAEATAALRDALQASEQETRPLARGELGLIRLKLGMALSAQQRHDEAMQQLEAALAGPCRDWVRGRAHMEMGRVEAARGRSQRARSLVNAGQRIAVECHDPMGVNEAAALLASLPPGSAR